MTLTSKQALLNYLEFLRESGYLYMEGESGGLEAVENAAPQSAAAPIPSPAVMPVESPTMPQARKPAARSDVPVDAGADLFGRPADPPPKAAAARTHAAPEPSGPPLAREERIARLAEAAARAEVCRACALGSGRNKLVYSDGDPCARIAFVGEAPGADEDASGIPFIGRAGQLLTKMIAAIGFRREEVYICNTVKCRPPNNRDPHPAEKDACEHFLVEQLGYVRPRILVALGSHAAQYLCRSEETIGRLRGRWHVYHGIPLLATYHPAFLLRSPNMKTRAWDDFQMIHRKYSELNPDDPRQIWNRGG